VKLSGGVAVLKICRASEGEAGEKKDKVTNALNATKAVVGINMFFRILLTTMSAAWGQAAFQGEGNVMYSASRRAACCARPTGLLMGYGLRTDWRLVGHCYKARQLWAKD
jgi:hypothetical protein